MAERILFSRGYKYQLRQTYKTQVEIFPEQDISHPFFSLTHEGTLTVQFGYSWDGASGPAIDSKDFMRGSLVHDVLYQAMGMGVLESDWRDRADQELRRICREDGMPRWRAWWVYHALRVSRTWNKPSQKKVEVAP